MTQILSLLNYAGEGITCKPTLKPPDKITLPVTSINSPSQSNPTETASESSGVNSLAIAMGAMAAGLFVLLVVILLLSVGCWWRRRKHGHRQVNHMHDLIGPLARYLRLEEPAQGKICN